VISSNDKLPHLHGVGKKEEKTKKERNKEINKERKKERKKTES